MKKPLKIILIIAIILVVIAGAFCAVFFIPSLKEKVLYMIEEIRDGELQTALRHQKPRLICKYKEDSGDFLVLLRGNPYDTDVPESLSFELTITSPDEKADIKEPIEIKADTISPITYAATGNIADYKYQQGIYRFDTNLTTDKKPEPASFEFRICPEGIQYDTETFSVSASDLTAPDKITAVSYNIWYSDDQKDLQNIPCEADENGQYCAAIDIQAHQYYSGTYHVELWITLENGSAICADSKDFDVTFKNLLSVNAVDDSLFLRHILLVNASSEKGEHPINVQFRSWSEEGGQDDLLTNDAIAMENNAWEITLNGENYANDGNGIAQAYGIFKETEEPVLLGEITFDIIRPKYIALTFDDGPSKYTPEILDQLNAYGAHATFFVVGTCASNYTGTLNSILASGSEIGNHTWDHTNLSKASDETIRSTVGSVQNLVSSATGITPVVMRPPGGNLSDAAKAAIGMPMILWSIDTRDWATRDTQSTINVVQSEVSDGSVILMHDLYEPTKNAALELIPWLHSQGYKMLTISELAALKGYSLNAGQTYRQFP